HPAPTLLRVERGSAWGQLEPFLSRESMSHSSHNAVIHTRSGEGESRAKTSDLRATSDLLLPRFGGLHDHIDQLVAVNCGHANTLRRLRDFPSTPGRRLWDPSAK